MYLKSITLKNYRNYKEETITFKEGLNVVIGNNAVGKTNLLESICCCGIGKSLKTTKYKELINFEEKETYIKACIQKKYREHIIEFLFNDKEKKKVRIDGIHLSKLNELIGILDIVYFSPDELKFIKEGPFERRRYMDISLSQQDKKYLYSLSNYNRIIEQRNKLLKENYDKENIKEMLEIWNMQLAKEGAYVVLKRYEFIEKLKEEAQNIHYSLTNGKETLELEYESIIKKNSQEEIEKEIIFLLQENIEKDLSLQYTTIGPHRDDIYITLDKKDVRKYGSQGQTRSCALSLKIAEISLFKKETGESPILLLDDVLSELDENRRTMLMEISSKVQTIITCTDFNINIPYNEIRIENGKLIKQA